VTDAELTALRAIESLLLYGDIAFDAVRHLHDRLEFTRDGRVFVLTLCEKKFEPCLSD
jgi:hypothetical protein